MTIPKEEKKKLEQFPLEQQEYSVHKEGFLFNAKTQIKDLNGTVCATTKGVLSSFSDISKSGGKMKYYNSEGSPMFYIQPKNPNYELKNVWYIGTPTEQRILRTEYTNPDEDEHSGYDVLLHELDQPVAHIRQKELVETGFFEYDRYADYQVLDANGNQVGQIEGYTKFDKMLDVSIDQVEQIPIQCFTMPSVLIGTIEKY